MSGLIDSKIALLAEFPAPIIYGGLEMFCKRSQQALQNIGAPVELVDYYNPDQRIDLLHIMGNPPNMYEIAIAAARTKHVVFSTVFGGAVISPLQSFAVKSFSALIELFGQKIDHTRVRSMFEVASHLMVLNEIELEFIHERYKIPFEKMSIVPVGVEDIFYSVDGTYFKDRYDIRDFILFTGNIIPRKNPLRLANALKSLDIPGVFIGKSVGTDIEYAQQFKKIIDSSPNLLWIEGISPEDPLLPHAYAAAKAFCLPSFAEGQSASSLEAMAAGKAVILADLPYSYQKCYPKVNRCNPNEEKSIKASIKQVLVNQSDYAYQLPDQYRWSSVAKQICTIYASII